MVIDFNVNNGTILSYKGISPEILIPDDVKSIGENVFAENRNIEVVDFPEGLEEIGDHAFFNCSIETVKLPSTLKKIGALAFGGFNPLKGFKLAKGNEYFAVVDGVLFSKDMTRLIMFPQNKSCKNYTIPDSVKVIEPFAFASVKDVNITIPEGVEEIGKMAFFGAITAGNIYLPSSVKKIADDAFGGFGQCSDGDVFVKAGSLAEVEVKNQGLSVLYY